MANTEGKTARAPVDGKRLAMLEAGVSALTMALAANGVELKDKRDPIEQAIVIVKRWRELTVARAELQLAVAIAVNVEPETIEDPLAAAGGALETMKARLLELEAIAAGKPSAEEVNDGALAALRLRVAELEEDLEAVTNAKNQLANLLADQDRPASPPVLEAEPEPEPEIVRDRPDAARDVGPTYGGLTSAEIQTLIEDDATFELAFSNGEFEIIDFSAPPIAVAAKDLVRVDTTRVRLKDGVEVTGASGVERLHGVGLLLEGVQVSYHSFEPAQIVRPQEHWRFAPVFG